MLFPVADGAATVVADDAFREAEIYDDGLAKEVHGAQSPARGDAIQLAWDDEQVAVWLQPPGAARRHAGELKVDAPSGVAGYRVDVRLAEDEDWNSLVRIESVGDLAAGPPLARIVPGRRARRGRSGSDSSRKRTGLFWLPSYYTAWRGSSLALMDEDLVEPSRAAGAAESRGAAVPAESREELSCRWRTGRCPSAMAGRTSFACVSPI